jgi:hypothetical protein
MIQRYLYTALKTGIEAIAADPEILDNLFQEQYSLSSTEMAAIKTYFDDNPVTIAHGYARSEDSFPRVCIVLADDTESDPYLGDDVGMVGDELDDEDEIDDEDYGADVTGSMWTAVFQLLCYAEGNPDVTIYLYEMVKDIIFAAIPYLKSVGLQKLGVSGGDMALDPQYVPGHLFARRVTFRCRYEFSHVDRKSKLGKAFAVAGIHIDSSGSPNTVDEVGVKTLVTPYSEE